MKEDIESIVKKENGVVQTILTGFRKKQGFMTSEVSAWSDDGIIVFDGQFKMTFSDILLDVKLGIPKGIAVNYMQGFDLDLQNGLIPKDLSYSDYLACKKLI